MLVQNLCRRQIKILLRDVDSALAQGKHSGFCTHALELCATAAIHLLGDLGKVDASGEVHASAVDPENVGSGFDGWGWKLDFAVDSAGSEQCWIENVKAVSGHNDLDILRRLEAVELVKEFQHRPLHLRVSAAGSFDSRGADAVNLVHEDDAGRVFSGHNEKLAHHSRAFSDVFLDQLAAADSDEFAVGVVSCRSCKKRLSSAGWSVEQDALGLCDPKRLKEFGMLETEFDDFLDFFDLLVQSSNHVICAVWDFLDKHERHEWIH